MVCCLCKRTKDEDRWVEKIVAYSKKMSHGYCPECFQKTMTQIRNNTPQAESLQYVKNKLV
jgi:hypothetical protein